MNKKVMFASNADKELIAFPNDKKEQFIQDIEMLKVGQKPLSSTKRMKGLGHGVTELRRNGRPAFRCVYVEKDNVIYILYAFKKTSDGTQKHHEEKIKSRFKLIP